MNNKNILTKKFNPYKGSNRPSPMNLQRTACFNQLPNNIGDNSRYIMSAGQLLL